MSELIPFPGKDYSASGADIDVEATEITLEEGGTPPARKLDHHRCTRCSGGR